VKHLRNTIESLGLDGGAVEGIAIRAREIMKVSDQPSRYLEDQRRSLVALRKAIDGLSPELRSDIDYTYYTNLPGIDVDEVMKLRTSDFKDWLELQGSVRYWIARQILPLVCHPTNYHEGVFREATDAVFEYLGFESTSRHYCEAALTPSDKYLAADKRLEDRMKEMTWPQGEP